MESTDFKKYQKAQKKVKAMKDFYGHILLFVVMVPFIFVIRFVLLPRLGITSNETGFRNWLNWNTYIFPLLWLLAIGIHALAVFKPKFIKTWEAKKLREILEKEATEIQKSTK